MRAVQLLVMMAVVALGAEAQAQGRVKAPPAAPPGAAGGLSVEDVQLPSSVSTSEAAAMIGSRKEMLLLDVRTTREFEQGHLPGAMHIPINEIPRRISELAPYRDRPILVYCRTDNRSSVARHYLARYGFSVSYMRGGVVSWSRAQRPLLR